MKQFDVEARRSAVALDEPEPAEYLVLGDFGRAPKNADVPLLIDRDNFDTVLAKFGLHLGGADFRELEDYHPDRLFQRLDWFREFRETPVDEKPALRRALPEANIAELLKPSSLLDQIVEGSDPFQRYVRELASASAAEPEKSPNAAKTARLVETMRAVLHHPRFQTIEAAWRGLDFVIRQSDAEADRVSRVRVAHFPKAQALDDLNNAANLRETRMFRLLKSRKWHAVIGIYSFGAAASDIEFLGRMALLAASADAPFIAEGSADMGDHWKELRSIPEASSIGLALPRFLLRLPYGAQTSPIDSFGFEEMPPGEPVHAHYLWGNPALVCLSLIMAGSALGVETLTLDGLPLHTYQHDGEWKLTPCTEVSLTETAATALMELGLMPLLWYKDSDRVRLAGFRGMNGKALALED